MKNESSRSGAGKVILGVGLIYTAFLMLIQKTPSASAWVVYGFFMLLTVYLAYLLLSPGVGDKDSPDAARAGFTAAFWLVQLLFALISLFVSLPLVLVIILEAVLTLIYLLLLLVLNQRFH